MDGTSQALQGPLQRFPTFSNLFQFENDLVGLIAYSLYKQEKIAFIEAQKEATGAAPSSAELSTFCRGANVAGRLIGYRQRAELLLQEMNGALVDDAVASIEADCEARLVAEVKKLPATSWPKHLFQHIVGSLLATGLAVLIVLTVLGWKQGFLKLGQDLLNVEITQKKP